MDDYRTQLARLSLLGPALVSQSAFIFMNLTDSIFVSFIGPDELAACALGNAFTWCFFWFAVCILRSDLKKFYCQQKTHDVNMMLKVN